MMNIEAIVHSQNEGKNFNEPRTYDKVEVIEWDLGKETATVKTKEGIVCSAIYNPWLGWMADDIYGIIRKE